MSEYCYKAIKADYSNSINSKLYLIVFAPIEKADRVIN